MFAVVSNVIAFTRMYAAGRARWQTSPNRTSGQQSLAEPEDRETRGVTGVERWTAVGDFAGKLFGNVHR
jgi:hypothetical protein